MGLDTPGTITLFRPTGPQELRLIESMGMKAFPPRLPQQPFFYPVTTFDYAEKIARDWNSTESDTEYKGFVLSFSVPASVIERWPIQTVGGTACQELWVPAEDLDELNSLIQEPAIIIARYERGKRVDESTQTG